MLALFLSILNLLLLDIKLAILVPKSKWPHARRVQDLAHSWLIWAYTLGPQGALNIQIESNNSSMDYVHMHAWQIVCGGNNT